MSKACETFHHTLKIIYDMAYLYDECERIPKKDFLIYFFDDLLGEPPKKYSDKEKPFNPAKGWCDTYRERILSGALDYPALRVPHVKYYMDHTGVWLSNRFDRQTIELPDPEIGMNQFRKIGIKVTGESFPQAVTTIIENYLTAINLNEDDPYGIEEKKEKPKQKKGTCKYGNGILNFFGKKISIAHITDSNYESKPESRHEAEILKAFEVKTEDELCRDDKLFLSMQRKAYTAASCMRYDLRDCLEDGEAPYEIIIREIKEAVQSVYVDTDLISARKRMREVLRESKYVQLSSSILCRETPLINSDNRQGICHILIDEDEFFKRGWDLT